MAKFNGMSRRSACVEILKAGIARLTLGKDTEVKKGNKRDTASSSSRDQLLRRMNTALKRVRSRSNSSKYASFKFGSPPHIERILILLVFLLRNSKIQASSYLHTLHIFTNPSSHAIKHCIWQDRRRPTKRLWNPTRKNWRERCLLHLPGSSSESFRRYRT